MKRARWFLTLYGRRLSEDPSVECLRARIADGGDSFADGAEAGKASAPPERRDRGRGGKARAAGRQEGQLEFAFP